MEVAVFVMWRRLPLSAGVLPARWGTPHIALSWTCRGNGNRYDPFAERHYLRCTYHGWTGSRPIPAQAGTCPWIRWLKEERR